MNDIIEGLVQAVNSGRTDIVRTVISTCQTGDVSYSEEINLNVLLNSPLTVDGTILHVAAKENQADIVRALLVAGADPCVQNKGQQTPLDLTSSESVHLVFNDQLLQCIAQSNIGRICQLLAAGVDVNLQDSPTYLNTPLHWAACYGNQEVIECLCNRGAIVNAVNSQGATPLHDAVLRGQIDIIEELLHQGAISVVNTKALPGKYKGQSPMELAAEKYEVQKILQNGPKPQIANGIKNSDLQEDLLSPDSVSVIPVVPSDLNVKSPTSLVPNGVIEPDTPPTSVPATPLTPLDTKTVEDNFSALKLSTETSNVKADPLQFLWPKPQKLIIKEGKPFRPPGGTLLIFLHCRAEPELASKVMNTWKTHELTFQELHLSFHIETVITDQSFVTPHVISEVNRKLFPLAESYRITILSQQIKIQASDIRGLHCAIVSLYQVFKFFKGDGIPNIQISDHPSIRDRGVILDMSKGRIPQLDCMKHLIKTLSYLKINQVQIYHRFSLPKDPSVRWQFPYTRSTMLELALYCDALNIELVPVLDLTPNVTIEDLDILYSSFQAFLSCFLSASLVGIGPRLSSFLVDITDEGELSLEDTEHFLPVQSHQTLQLCAFVFHDIPHILAQYPCNMTLAEYGFQACYEFEKHSSIFQENGIPFHLIPGTAAWNSLAGCPEAAVKNIHKAVNNVISHGGLGILVSHWSGVSHMTHQSMIWPGVLAAAGLAWNCSIEQEFLHSNLAELINRHILEDQSGIVGQVIVELGRAETYLLRCSRNQAGTDHSNLPAEKGTSIYQLLTYPDQLDIEHLSLDVFQKTMRHIRKCQSELSKANLQCYDGSIIVSELQITADLMLTACRVGRQLVNVGKKPDNSANYESTAVNLGVANLPPTAKTDLANRLLSQIENYRTVWLSRNLPQGLQDSLLILSNMLKQFMPEEGINSD